MYGLQKDGVLSWLEGEVVVVVVGFAHICLSMRQTRKDALINGSTYLVAAADESGKMRKERDLYQPQEEFTERDDFIIFLEALRRCSVVFLSSYQMCTRRTNTGAVESDVRV